VLDEREAFVTEKEDVGRDQLKKMLKRGLKA
jgi:hypothetical protein